MDNRKRTFPANCIRLCFDGFNTELCEGTICGVTLKEDIPFCGMKELIVKIDNAFNEIGQPQAYQVLRSFGKQDEYQAYKSQPEHFHDSEEIAARQGMSSTFDLIMTSRHRAEWQGILKNIEGENIGSFNSSLECMNLLGRII